MSDTANSAQAILEIERLVKAQDEIALVENVDFGNGVLFAHKILSTEFGRQLGDLLDAPRPQTFSVSTLTGLVDAINSGVCGEVATLGTRAVVHVADHLTVSVRTTGCDRFGKRDTLLTAKHEPIDAFKFDDYYNDPARFIIALQTAFLQTEELLYLQRLASNLKADSGVRVEDDGFSQSVSLKTGEVTTAEVKVKPRIRLLPIRTFSEAAPVEGEFLIRFKQTPQQTPSIALFVVDGNKWKGETMRSIKKWLGENLPGDIPILA